MNLDEIDRRILAQLQADARTSNADLARHVGLSPTPCLRRVRRLEQSGVIQGYRAVLAPQHTGRALRALVGVRLTRHNRTDVRRFEARVRQLDQVESTFHVTGNYDYVLLVAVADLTAYEAFHADYLTDLPAVAHVTTYIVMNQLDNTTPDGP